MSHFASVKDALAYIDEHLDDELTFETLARRFHFSPYYFHRVFSAIAGKTIAVHIRDRRLLRAGVQLCTSARSILAIGLDSGYDSAAAFSRAFKSAFGLTPSQYRRQGVLPAVPSVDELLQSFTDRLTGGIYMNPAILQQGALLIAGVTGEGARTADAWRAFEQLSRRIPLANALHGHGYEIRLYTGDTCVVHVGFAVADERVDPAYALYRLPASQYAVFTVYTAQGYDSQNGAVEHWLQTNGQGYAQRPLGDAYYCVEYYDERFARDGGQSILELWVSVQRQ